LRPEAEWLVERVWRRENGPAEVEKALRANRSLSEPLRQAALRAVLKQAQPPKPAPGDPDGSPYSTAFADFQSEFVGCLMASIDGVAVR
jgi:hypothetical protein